MMRFRRRNIKFIRFLLICVLVTVLSGSLLIHYMIKNNASNITSNNTALASDKNGSIEFEENTLFKKYTINFNTSVSSTHWSDSGDTVNVNFNSGDITNPALNNTNVTGIYKSNLNQQNNQCIKIKKLFNEGNKIYPDYTDNKKLIILISKVKNPFKYKVVLDPGHGGRDPGNINGKFFEKDITLKLCRYMYNDLMFNGYQVVLTRDKDSELDKLVKNDLIKRANIANDNKTDIFVSIHVNAGNVKDKNFQSYEGVSTYYYLNKDAKQNNERIKLAQTIQKHAVQSDGWQNRKILAANDSVLRNTAMPSVLVECGFLTNTDDVKRLTNETVLGNLGHNIDKGIMEYLLY